jgi:hypothetical protein
MGCVKRRLARNVMTWQYEKAIKVFPSSVAAADGKAPLPLARSLGEKAQLGPVMAGFY